MTDWLLAYDDYDPDQERLREALCTVGNGYLGSRGAAPEADAGEVHYPGTYVAGVYNRLVADVAGQRVENESLVNVPNWLPLTFRIDGGPWFRLEDMELLEYQQELDMRQGILTRRLLCRDADDRLIRMTQRRFAHMHKPHLLGLHTTVVAENWGGVLEFRSALDGRVSNDGVPRYRDLGGDHLVPVATGQPAADTVSLEVKTNQSQVHIALASRTRVDLAGEPISVQRETTEEDGYVAQELKLEVREGDVVSVDKVVALYTSRDRAISASGLAAAQEVERAAAFDDLLASHVMTWGQLWDLYDVDLDGHPRAGLAVHVHLLHILQTLSHNTIDLDAGVPARGLHGEAYRGHVFWDELFVFPSITLRTPDVSRALLRYRSRRIEEARWAAIEAGYAGAMFPWQSGSDGREETQTWHLNPRSGRWLPDNSQLQRHVNVAIAYNTWRYYEMTGDKEFLWSYGAEMILSIARFLASLAEYNPAIDRYEIKGVMGPDEYHDAYPDADEPGLDNNAYTNVMTVWVILRALDLLGRLPQRQGEGLRETLGLLREEIDTWEEISRKMCIPFHGDRIISQFAGYGDLEELDWDHYKDLYGEVMRLDRILEQEGKSTNRYKASKQADVLMLFFLLSVEELSSVFERLGYEFDDELVPRNIEYYIDRTSHGSTLSQIVHAWVLSRLDRERSWELFSQALESDISDIQGGTTPEGIHLGAMAGTVDIAQRCYAGIEAREEVLWFNPLLPKEIEALEFNICYRGVCLRVRITADLLTLSSEPGEAKPIRVNVADQFHDIPPGTTEVFEL